MRSRDLLTIRQRQTEFRKWKPKEDKMKPPTKQQSSDDFIAQGGRVIYGEPVKFDYFAQCKKTGFMDRV